MVFALLAAGCQEGFILSPSPVRELPETPVATPAPTQWVIAPTATPTLVPQPTQPSPTPRRTPYFSTCSPLQGYRLDQIPELISNPYNPPPPGSDDPHAGIDFSDRQPGTQIALAGRAVQAVLPGRVAAVVENRFPFGNALLVETPLSELPEDWISGLNLPPPFTGLAPHTRLTCPQIGLPDWSSDRRSLYLLYAHMLGKPSLSLEELVDCGQELGSVGSSGNALNPHLHLEARVGPSEARFQSLSHYDNRATLAEMDAYCTWTVRGEFQLINPLLLSIP